MLTAFGTTMFCFHALSKILNIDCVNIEHCSADEMKTVVEMFVIKILTHDLSDYVIYFDRLLLDKPVMRVLFLSVSPPSESQLS